MLLHPKPLDAPFLNSIDSSGFRSPEEAGQRRFWKNEPIFDFSLKRSKWLIYNNLGAKKITAATKQLLQKRTHFGTFP